MPTASIGQAPKACDLLTTQQAAELWGGSVSAGEDAGKRGILCTYQRPHDEFVMVKITDIKNWGANAPRLFQAMNTPDPKYPQAVIPSLGEQNVYYKATDNGNSSVDNTLSFRQHGYWVVITVRGPDTPRIKDAIVKAGQIALAKLP